MAHTYTSIPYHLVFSTKGRVFAISEPQRLWAYLAGIAKNLHYQPFAIGGIGNHIHALVGVPPVVSAAEAVQKLKANSSRWLREKGKWPGWQEGYGAFSVSASNVDAVRHYIQNQEEHHRRQTYEAEFLSFLERSGASFDKDEVFDQVPSLKGLKFLMTSLPGTPGTPVPGYDYAALRAAILPYPCLTTRHPFPLPTTPESDPRLSAVAPP